MLYFMISFRFRTLFLFVHTLYHLLPRYSNAAVILLQEDDCARLLSYDAFVGFDILPMRVHFHNGDFFNACIIAILLDVNVIFFPRLTSSSAQTFNILLATPTP